MKSFTLHDLPSSERPRERLIQHGSEVLSLQELLALILGRGVQGESVMTTAQKLLAQFGSLAALLDASLEDLQQVKGVGVAKACQIKACLEIARRVNEQSFNKAHNKKKKQILSPQEVFQLLKPKLVHHKKEYFMLISFDTRNTLLSIDTISIGTLNASLVHPRELFEIAIRHHAASVIIAHNHPSGDPDPSDEDIRVTAKLTEAGKLLGIQVLDHIIVGNDRFYSFSS
jgi:DNA repair protein RadC